MKARRAVVALSVASAAVAETVGAVSLTRIAGDHLGFPAGLAWTFTASVAVGAVAGAIMWSVGAAKSGVRSTGVQLNVACSLLCAAGVGLDHAVNATSHRAWQVAAFLVGAFLPLLSTWLVHALAKIGTPETATKTETPAKTTAAVETSEPEFVEPAPRIPMRVAPTVVLETVPEAPAVEVDAETVKEIDEIEAHRVMRDTKPRVNREAADISAESVLLKKAVAFARRNPTRPAKDVQLATGVSRATAYRAVKLARRVNDETAASA